MLSVCTPGAMGDITPVGRPGGGSLAAAGGDEEGVKERATLLREVRVDSETRATIEVHRDFQRFFTLGA